MKLLLFLSIIGANDWWTTSVEVFSPLNSGRMCLAKDSIYVADGEGQLIKFDRKGKRVKVVAHRGQGPEDLSFPFKVFGIGDKVHVLDMEHLKTFGPEGFEKAVLLPQKRLIILYPVVNGWVYLDRTIFVTDGVHHLFWADHNFKHTETLADWSEALPDEVRKSPVTKKVVRTGRPHELSFLRVTKDGKTIFFKKYDTTQILIYDSLTRVLRRTVEMGRPIPVMTTDPYGNLHVRLKNVKDTRVIDKNGNDVPKHLPFGILNELIEIENGWAYWGFYDFEEDEMVLAGCRETDIDTFLKAQATRFKLDLN